MPWQNNEDQEGPERKGDGERRNPWGSGADGRRNKGEPGNGPRNPWGDGPEPGGDGRQKPAGAGNTPDFDEFIRRSQEKLRGLGGGGNGSGGASPSVAGAGRGFFKAAAISRGMAPASQPVASPASA